MGLLKHEFACVCCGKKGRTNQSGKKYCSRACQMKMYRKDVKSDVSELRHAVTSLKSENDVTTRVLQTVTEKLKENANEVLKKKYHLSESHLFCPLCGYYLNLCVCCEDDGMEYQRRIQEMWNTNEYQEWKKINSR